MIANLLFLVALSLGCCLPLKPMLFPRDHARYVAPAVADIPNVTYRGGLI